MFSPAFSPAEVVTTATSSTGTLLASAGGGGALSAILFGGSIIKIPEGHRGYRLHYLQAKRPTDGRLLEPDSVRGDDGRIHAISRLKGAPEAKNKAGEFYKIYRPGLNFGVPFVHNLVTVNFLPQTLYLPPEFMVDRKDGQYAVRGSLTWAVIDDEESGYKSIFKLASFDEKGKVDREVLPKMVANICLAGLGEVLGNVPKTKINNHKELKNRLVDCRGDELNEYGVEIQQVNTVAAHSLGEKVERAGNASSSDQALRAIAVAITEQARIRIPSQLGSADSPHLTGLQASA